MNQLYPYLFLAMGKRTELSILTFLNIVRKVRTEFFLVALILIQLLNSRMCIRAIFSIWAFLIFKHVLAHYIIIEISISFVVFGAVIVNALFMQVRFGD